MAVKQFAAAPYNGLAGGAEIRQWVQAVSDALEDIGMVRVPTTGEIDIPTIVNPPAAQTPAGFQIWRFNDECQAEAPLFFKVEYGRGGSGTNTPAQPTPMMWLTVGRGVNLAGDITGVLHPRTLSGYRSSGVASDETMTAGFASSGADGAMCAIFPFAGASLSNSPPAFIIERSRDRDGNPTPDGVLVAQQTGFGTAGLWFINYTSAAVVEHGQPGHLPYAVNGAPLSTGSLLGGVIAPLFPIVAYAPGAVPWQSRALVIYPPGDAPTGLFDARLAGTTRTYRALPDTSIDGWARASAHTGGVRSYAGCVGIEWE